MSRENQPGLDRSSSFARSFFQAGQMGDDSLDAYAAAGGAPPGGVDQNGIPHDAAAAGERPGLGRRQRSRRRSSKGKFSGDAAAAAASSINYEEGEPTTNLPHMGDDNGSKERQSSWYTDILLQGGGAEDINSILGQVQDPGAQSNDPVSPDDEVLEQYRIMAHVEANIRVKDNTGFDMAEYEKRRKLQPEPQKGDYYTGKKKPKPIPPEPRLHGGGTAGMRNVEEPPLPPPRANRRFVDQRDSRVPEMSAGVVVRGQTHGIPRGEHYLRCLGCKVQLRVNMLSTLVNCPECSTVSPASSTRR